MDIEVVMTVRPWTRQKNGIRTTGGSSTSRSYTILQSRPERTLIPTAMLVRAVFIMDIEEVVWRVWSSVEAAC